MQRKFPRRQRPLSRLRSATCVASLMLLGGCHSRFVEATIDNRGSHPLREVEVDYPSAGFGTSKIAPNSKFHYRFKILGSGSAKLSFVDDEGKAHTFTGPELDEGQEGTLNITIDEAGKVQWRPSLNSPK